MGAIFGYNTRVFNQPVQPMRIRTLLGSLILSFYALSATAAEGDLPCPPNWRVEPNASVENSLSYVHNSNELAVSVSYLANRLGNNVSAQNYARVASQKMICDVPVMSNLIQNAWSFTCDKLGIEAIIYGPTGNLVMLAISGRSEANEAELENFIRFLAHEARR